MTSIALFVMSGVLAAGPHPAGRVDPPAEPGAFAPRLESRGGSTWISWIEPVASGEHRVQLSFLRDGAWSEPGTIVQSDAMFANWADFPSVVQAADGTFVAHWLRKSGPGTYAYDVVLTKSTDGGRTWREIGSPHDDGTRTEHGFVSLLPDGAGVRAFWLDGREMAAGDEQEPGSMTLRSALVHPEMGESELLDARVCECCATSAALTAHGPIVVYRNRGASETRDVYFTRRAETSWTGPRAVHRDGWTIDGCPVNGPAVAAAGAEVVVAWYTAASGRPAILVAFSSDGGAHFGLPRSVDAGELVGRVDLLLHEPGKAIVSWLDTELGEGVVRLRRVSARDRPGPPVTVARTGTSRTVGTPQIARAGETLVVAWVEDAPGSRIRATRIPLKTVLGSEPPP